MKVGWVEGRDGDVQRRGESMYYMHFLLNVSLRFERSVRTMHAMGKMGWVQDYVCTIAMH